MTTTKYENLKNYSDADFKAATGISPETFNAMLEVIKVAYAKTHSKHNGRHRKLSREDMLLMTLEYYKEYRTQECLGASYGLRKSNVGKTIKWVEEALISSGLFSLPGKRNLAHSDTKTKMIVVDTTETPIQRPSHKQRRYYSGKKSDIL